MLYAAMCQAKVPGGYAGKLFSVAFVGTHIPLIALVGYGLRQDNIDPTIFYVALGATVAGTVLAFWGLHSLLRPIRQATEALDVYLDHGEVRSLLATSDDIAGQLLRGVQGAIRQLDARIERLDRQASTDPLTGALNRRAAEQIMSNGRQHDWTVGLVDIDDFKHINDRGGHELGDRVLKAVVRGVETHLRSREDFVARWGGDELLVAFRELEANKVEQVAARLLEAIRAETYPLAEAAGREVTVSLGLATGTPNAELLAEADAQLYRAKGKGKRTFSVAPTVDLPSPVARQPPRSRSSVPGPTSSPALATAADP